MICNSCQFDNPNGMKFCGSCGSKLDLACSTCGTPNPNNFKFCGNCGNSFEIKTATPPAPVVVTPPPLTPPPYSPPPVVLVAQKEAERRHLTVMFCDVVGSTALSERLDAEEFRQVILDYQAVAEQVIYHYNGHIAQYLGDGIMAYFGYPNALEDAPVMGIKSGLELLESLELANQRWHSESKPTVDIRIGVHTGLTVVDDHLALGETCNAAARLQDKAEKNTMVISADAAKLVKGWFETQSKGEHLLKGLSRPMEIFTVKGESGARSRMDLSLAGDLTPLVGRDSEMKILQDCVESMKAKKGSVVLVSGEAGLGKSRLIHDIKEKAEKTEKLWLVEFNCSTYYQNSAFYPVIDAIEHVSMKINRRDTIEEKYKKIEQFLDNFGFDLAKNVPLLANLLSIPLSGSAYTNLDDSAETQKQKIMELLLSIMLKRAEQHRVMIVFEDVHWADPTTLELIDMVIKMPPSVGILIVLTYRPQLRHDWGNLSHIVPIGLSNLTDSQSNTIISKITKGKTLPKEVLKQIVEKTDGIPLFVEELTKMVLESGLVKIEGNHYVLTGPLPPLAIPATLQDSLKARLDRFSSAKEVVYWASVIGKDFSYELLEACCPIDKGILQGYLKELVHSGLLYQKGFPPHADYQFRHSLMQNAAYESILRSRRQTLHQRIALALVEKFPEKVATQPELPAHHFTEAGLNDQAIGFWQQASEKAMKASAYVEALHHIDKGLKLVGKMQQSDKRIQFELAFQVRNSTIIKIQEGWSSDKVKKAYDHCFELCQSLGDSEELFTTIFGIWAYYLIGGNINQSYETAVGCAELTERLNNPSVTMQAHLMVGNSLFWLARYDEAIVHFDTIFNIHENLPTDAAIVGFGHDTRVVAYMLWVWSLAMKGDLETAYQKNKKSLDLAIELRHPFTEAIARCTACWFYEFTRDTEKTFQQAQLAIDLGFPAYQCWGQMLKGWSMASSGKTKKGIEEIKRGYQIFKDSGCGLETYPSVLLAEAYILDEDYAQALVHIEKGLLAVETNKEMVFEAELLRLKAIVTHYLNGDSKEINQFFQQSLVIGEKTKSGLSTFRTAVSWNKTVNLNGGATPEIIELLETQKGVVQVNHFDKYLKRETALA